MKRTLKEARKERGLSIMEASRKINISPLKLVLWENGFYVSKS